MFLKADFLVPSDSKFYKLTNGCFRFLIRPFFPNLVLRLYF